MNAANGRIVASLIAGATFGLGLAVSGLANPDNVLQFLTIDSNWSPALLVTMAAAIAVTSIGYRWVLNRGPILESKALLPTKVEIDRRLLIGSAIFGAGWGFAGFCPGPAISALSSLMIEPYVFVAAMIVGSQLQRVTSRA